MSFGAVCRFDHHQVLADRHQVVSVAIATRWPLTDRTRSNGLLFYIALP